MAVPAIVAGGLTFFTFMISGHGRPSLFPTAGFVTGCALDLLLVASYAPVLRLARQADARAGEVLAAGAAWAAAVALIGVIVAPGVVFMVPCALLLALSVFGVYLSTRDAAELWRAFLAGAVWVIAAGVLFVPVRLREQAITRHPAVLEVYRRAGGHQCDVRPAGSAGEISLWRQDCESAPGPIYGWDERAQVLLEGDRVPKTR